MSKQNHTFHTIDYEHSAGGLFVQIAGMDGASGKSFTGVVKFVQGRPYGEIIHPEKTHLSEECRAGLFSYLIKKYNEKDFE